MKPFAWIVSVSALLWTFVAAEVLHSDARKFIDVASLSRMPVAAVSCLAVSAVMTVAWLLFFTTRSVWTAAFTYAEMLLRACDTL